MKRIGSGGELKELQGELAAKRPEGRRAIAVCAGTGCKAFGSFKLLPVFAAELKKRKLEKEVELRPTGCHGFCERGPLVLMFPQGVLYTRVKAEDVPEIVEKTVVGGGVVERLLYQDPVTGKRYQKEHEIPFYAQQHRLVLKNNGLLDPTSIEDYLGLGGYGALAKALRMGAEAVVEAVKESGLRGRGGAGFLTGVKWERCRANTSGDGKRVVICNADEGDPGAFMDRSVVEGNPHSVLEGMVIGAYAMGASEGYVYIRQEYPLAVERLGQAVEQAREAGLLGKDILGSGFEFEVKIYRGGGAFVCGEESALIASIEGRRGVPRRRPPYPSQSGLWGKPTCINNVETWANVPWIIEKGAGWYRSIGTEGSKGTKIFSLVGKVNNTGLVEVPMGMSLRQIVFGIGGGIPTGKQSTAGQTGGPSGGCLPEGKLDVAVDFDTLVREGAMMGSGGMIVMDEDTCMVDVAKYFLKFLKSESCGNCTSCREGLVQLHRLLTEVTEGRGTEGMLEEIGELAGTVRATSLCALGTTAVNPVESTLKYFREEYQAHVRDKRCPARVCKALIKYEINEKCNGCTLCAKRCPQGAVAGEKKAAHRIEQGKCIKCGICADVCNQDAVTVG
jgi:NADH-quinone oxidoreductase subunit F